MADTDIGKVFGGEFRKIASLPGPGKPGPDELDEFQHRRVKHARASGMVQSGGRRAHIDFPVGGLTRERIVHYEETGCERIFLSVRIIFSKS